MRLVAAVVAGVVAACGAYPGVDPEDRTPSDVGAEVTVFAAASLTDAFRRIADEFEEIHPFTEVTLNLAGSQTLATQIVEGAPADVFASADTVAMQRVVGQRGVVDEPATFATNELAIVVAPGNPHAVTGLADLASPDLTVVLAAPEVPAGRYARAALDQAGVTVAPASLEPDVRRVLTRVRLGEADAGIVFATDAAIAGDEVTAVPLADVAVDIAYPIAVVDGAPNPGGGQAFVRMVRSPAGRRILAEFGFGAP